MGICNNSRCCQDYEVIRTGDNYHFSFDNNNKMTCNSTKDKIFLNNCKSISSNQLILSNKYFQILNEIRQNPSNYINESKCHNLFEIFLKLKPSKSLKFSKNDILDIIYYLEKSQEKTINEKENGVKSLINNGNINNLCLFQYIASEDDINNNIWLFFEENEDDIDKILTINYDFVMIVCLPIQNTKSNITFIFYDELK